MTKYSLCIFLVLVATSFSCRDSDECKLGPKLFSNCVESGLSSGQCIVNLAELFPFEWDRVFMIYGPNNPWDTSVEENIEFSHALQDGERWLVFARGRKVMCIQVSHQSPTGGAQVAIHSPLDYEDRFPDGYTREYDTFLVHWQQYDTNCHDCYHYDLSPLDGD